MAIYEMKFMFDWGSGVCVWSANDAARKSYDYPVYTEDLPISNELKKILNHLIEKHDEALDLDCPQNQLLWNDMQIQSFKSAAVEAYKQLCDELGGQYKVVLEEEYLI